VALGATPQRLDLTEALAAIVSGSIDAQENPLANTVTYGAHRHHRFHTLTGHFYVSRPLFFHRPTFDALPEAVRECLRAAVAEAVIAQRQAAEQEEVEAAAEIVSAGGKLLELTADEHARFVAAVRPFKSSALAAYDPELVSLVGERNG